MALGAHPFCCRHSTKSNFHTHVLNTFAKNSKTGPVDTHWWVRVLAEQEGASLKSNLFKVGHGWTCKQAQHWVGVGCRARWIPRARWPAYLAEMLSSRLSERPVSAHKAKNDNAIQQRVSRKRAWTRMRITCTITRTIPSPHVLQGSAIWACCLHPSPFPHLFLTGTD